MRHSLVRILCLLCAAAWQTSFVGAQSNTAAAHHHRGVEHHLRRALDEASREYARALAMDPARDATADELQVVQRFAPRIHVVPSEVFGLKDVAAIVHPEQRLIAYHLFWDDDIDFPEDNDPCDHEVLWVQYAADRQTLERVWTYFHGRILDGGEAALRDAREHEMRPRVDVQWGKHGTMPVGWETVSIRVEGGDAELPIASGERQVTLKAYNEGTFRRLSTTGRRLPEHPLGIRLGWPVRFAGSASEFVAFTRVVDPRPRLGKTGMVKVSRWNSATINQHFLTYNFRPKTEWPIDVAVPATATSTRAPVFEASSPDIFRLPPKTAFDKTMPRYPNVWFYVDRTLAPSYRAAVDLVTTHVRETMRADELFGPFDNPEGCDFEVRLEHLQPWEPREPRELRPLTHAHAFHMRYYFSALEAQKLESVTVSTKAGPREFYRVAASAHYEVEHANPHHADVEACPVCGRTGEYKELKGNLVEQVHDPLGLELLLTGTIRGEAVRFEDYERRAVGGILATTDRVAFDHVVFPAQSGDRNTLRIGIVVMTPAPTR
jgi:hypothetical protein